MCTHSLINIVELTILQSDIFQLRRNESNHNIGTSYFVIKFNPYHIITAVFMEDIFRTVQLPRSLQWSGKMANSNFYIISF